MLVMGFDDLMVGVIILSVFVTMCVVLRFELGSLSGVNSDTTLYSNFEIVWLLRPVIVFVTVGLISLTISYELLRIEWVDVMLNMVAAQWYWNENFMLEGQENSTLIRPFVTHSSCSDK